MGAGTPVKSDMWTTSKARGLAAGALFTLTNYPRTDQNREYLIVSAKYKLQSDVFGSSGTGEYRSRLPMRIRCLGRPTPYRPPWVMKKAGVQGPRAPSSSARQARSRTDQYGRVKLQFH